MTPRSASDSLEPYGSFGNGSAMRVSPVGCAFDVTCRKSISG